MATTTTETRYCGTYRDEFVVEPGDYLIGMDGEFRCHIWHGPRALLNQRVCRLRRFKESVDPVYVYYGVQKYLSDIEAQTAFVTVKHISGRQIQDIVMPLPAIAEQKRIANLLLRADNIARMRREAEQKAKQIIPALFVDMFGDPATNPRGWPSTSIDDVCTLVRGSSPRPQGDPRYFGGAIPRLMIADITRDGIYVTPRIDSLTVEGAQRSRPMLSGDVVMAVSGAVGLPAILAVDACIHDGFVGFRALREDLGAEYLYAYLSIMRRQNAMQAVGATFQNLKTDQIRLWRIPLPPRKTQQLFVDRCTSVRRLEVNQARAISWSESVFKSLLNEGI